MAIVHKNPNYQLRYVEPATGCGLLYSEADDLSFILDPSATALWKSPASAFDVQQASNLFSEVSGIEGADKYFTHILYDLVDAGALTPDSSIAKPESHPALGSSHPPLQSVYFYATRECNQHCYHCYQPTIKVTSTVRDLQPHQLSAGSFLAFLANAQELGLRHVKLTGGEALLRKDLREIIAGADGLGLQLSLETNAYLLDSAWAEFLADHHVYVSISLDGPSPAIHDRLRGQPGSFHRVISALTDLSAAGARAAIIMSVSRLNVDVVEEVVATAASAGCHLVKLNPVNTLGMAKRLMRSKVLLQPADIMALYKQRARIESRYGVYLYIEGPPAFTSLYDIKTGHSAVCPFTNILGVLSDGSLSFCGVANSSPELIFGRIDDPHFNLQEFWYSAKALLDARATLDKRLSGVCGECLLEPLCKGSCRALAYGQFGDFSAPHPWCQQAFDEGIFPTQYLRQLNGGE